MERSVRAKNNMRDIEKYKEEIKRKQLNILKVRNKLSIAKRRLNHVFSFYTSSATSDHLQQFREFLKERKVQHADQFIIHDIRKIVLNQLRDSHGDKVAKQFAQHSSLTTTYKHYIQNRYDR